jgi:hypothetical protein
MKEERDAWDKLNHLTEEYQPPENLADRVIEKVNTKQSSPKFKSKTFYRWATSLACVCICVIGLAIFLPLYFSSQNNNNNVYYSTDSIEYSEIADMDSFINENNLTIHYYQDEGAFNRCAKVKESGQLAFIMQDVMYFTDTALDFVNLKVTLIANAEYEELAEFDILSDKMSINALEVSYSEEEQSSGTVYKAKFSYQENTYYLEITTTDGDVGKIEEYINILLN